jgi:hypothetical protein
MRMAAVDVFAIALRGESFRVLSTSLSSIPQTLQIPAHHLAEHVALVADFCDDGESRHCRRMSRILQNAHIDANNQ